MLTIETNCLGHEAGLIECPGPQGELSRLVGEITCSVCLPVSYVKIRQGKERLEAQQAELEQKAYFDQLTNLPNRHRLDAEFNDLVEKGTPLAGMTVDLTKFKHVNDMLGHSIGDKVLIYVADFLKEQSRADELFAARRGGDEFALLIKLVDRKTGDPISESSQEPVLKIISDRLKTAFADESIIGSYNQHVPDEYALGLRLGYALLEPGMGLEELIAAADSKGQGPVKEPDSTLTPFIMEFKKNIDYFIQHRAT